jgi:beta-galactosidase/beta-glucuronidase
VKNPRGIWYTPVTGIWQTVWLETVPASYISHTKQTPNLDNSSLLTIAKVVNAQHGDEVRVTAWDGTSKVADQLVRANGDSEITLTISNPKIWSTENPFLYDLTYTLLRKGKMIDEVKSYFAMRKISMKPDSKGIQRMLLNDKFVFQYGPLDQGWWPDGLYTAPTDEALKFDIEKTK